MVDVSRLARVVVLIGSLFVLAGYASAQCPMCKTGLVSSPEGQQMAEGFNLGILFLFCVPFVVIGTVTLLILRAHRQTRGESSDCRFEIENSSQPYPAAGFVTVQSQPRDTI